MMMMTVIKWKFEFEHVATATHDGENVSHPQDDEDCDTHIELR